MPGWPGADNLRPGRRSGRAFRGESREMGPPRTTDKVWRQTLSVKNRGISDLSDLNVFGRFRRDVVLPEKDALGRECVIAHNCETCVAIAKDGRA